MRIVPVTTEIHFTSLVHAAISTVCSTIHTHNLYITGGCMSKEFKLSSAIYKCVCSPNESI